MAVKIPTITETYDQILNDIASEFSVDVSTLGRTYRVFAKVIAGIVWIVYLALSKVQKNNYYDLAEEDQLIRFGQGILGRKPAPAEQGEYTLQVTGSIGAVIPASTQFRANDDTLAAGYLFVVDTEFTLTAETDNLTIRALTAGTESALYVDNLLTSTAPIADVDSEGKVTAITKIAVAAESIESYRADIVAAVRIEPQGGSPGDYRKWSLEVPEVRTTYPFAKDGNAGDVDIYVEATKENTAPLEIDGVPTQDTLDEVYKNEDNVETGAVVINSTTGKGRKPIGVFNVYSLPVEPVPVDIYFTGLSDGSIADDIKTAIDNLLYEIRPFVSGADVISNKNDILTLGLITSVIIEVLSGTGITYTTLVMNVDGAEETSYQFIKGFYPYLNTINNEGNPI